MSRDVARFRGLAAGTLSALSSVLGVGSRVAEQGATLLRRRPPRPEAAEDQAPPAAPQPMPWDRPAPPDDTPPGPAGPLDADEVDAYDRGAGGGVVVDDLADTGPDVVEDLAAVDEEPPAARPPVFEETSHRRSPDTHAAALADRPAADVIPVVDALSTDELRALYEVESSHKKRKTVLAAIERALSPR